MANNLRIRDFDFDIKEAGISLRTKLAVIVSDFLDIECSCSQDLSPKEAQQLRKTVLRELKSCIKNNLQYRENEYAPLWHKLLIVGIYFLHRTKRTRKNRRVGYLLMSLSHLIRTAYRHTVH